MPVAAFRAGGLREKKLGTVVEDMLFPFGSRGEGSRRLLKLRSLLVTSQQGYPTMIMMEFYDLTTTGMRPRPK